MENGHSDGVPRLHLVSGATPFGSAKLYRLLARSHPSLKGYVGLKKALMHGHLGYRLRDLIAIYVAEANGCVYMLSTHVATARRAGIDEETIADARNGRAADARTDAALRFVNALVHTHGNVNDAELGRLSAAGFDDASIVEIICNVGLQLLTDYLALCGALAPDEERIVPHVYNPRHD
jgi:AhpD family alkylhydroperoxidase